MFAIENFALFIAAVVMLKLTPGQDTMYIIGQSLARGRVAGVWSALGISVGSLVHTVWCLVVALSSARFSARTRSNPAIRAGFDVSRADYSSD